MLLCQKLHVFLKECDPKSGRIRRLKDYSFPWCWHVAACGTVCNKHCSSACLEQMIMYRKPAWYNMILSLELKKIKWKPLRTVGNLRYFFLLPHYLKLWPHLTWTPVNITLYIWQKIQTNSSAVWAELAMAFSLCILAYSSLEILALWGRNKSFMTAFTKADQNDFRFSCSSPSFTVIVGLWIEKCTCPEFHDRTNKQTSRQGTT